MGILDVAASQGWAMLPERAEELVSIVERENNPSLEVLEAYEAKYADRGERVRVRDGVAILDVAGPLFKKANLFVRISGATSYEILRRDFQVAVDDPAIHSIILKVDSPGGEANGCDELAAAIYEVRGKKPITAFVSGMAASGGYWIASAADRVVISEAAMLGSIGVVLGVQDKTAADEKRGVKTIEFVSSQSPGKRPDPTTDAGKARIQTMVDDLAEVFIAAVAKHRGVTAEAVVENFGGGGMKVGAKAVAAGMADEVGQLEATITSLTRSGKGRFFNPSEGVFHMTDNPNGPSAAEIAAKAKTDAQNRIKAIINSDGGKAMASLANHLAFETDVSAEDAGKILAAGKADVDAASAAASKTSTTVKEGDEGKGDGKEKSFVEHKTDAGALGLGKPEAMGAAEAAVDAGWKTAVDTANTRFSQ